MNSNQGKQKLFVIYQITNLLDNRIYVGAHCTYNINDKYMGSSKYLKKDLKELGKQNFRKEILHIFDNKEDMIKMETEIVNKEFCHRIDTYNRMVGGISDYCWNMVTIIDKQNNIFNVYKDDPRYLSGELKSLNKGKINVKDKEGKIFWIEKDDPRYLSGELKSRALGMVPVKDINNNFLYVSTDDPKYLSGELIHVYKGTKRTDKEKEQISKSSLNKKKSDEHINNMKKKKSKEHIINMAKSKEKKFYIYDLDGNFLSEEISIKKYAEKININHAQISNVLNGKRKQTNKLRFFFTYQGNKIEKYENKRQN